MGILGSWFRRGSDARGDLQISAMAESSQGGGVITSHDIAKALREVYTTQSGVSISIADAMKIPAVFRSVSLISNSIGMLPFHLLDADTKEKAREHTLFRLLHRQPNSWQTAFDFRAYLQYQALTTGNGYALIVRSMGRIIHLVPLPSSRVIVRQLPDWSLEYSVTLPNGSVRKFPATDIFHLRGMSDDGFNGMSLVKAAAEAIALAMQTQNAAVRLFTNGMMVGGKIRYPKKLSEEAKANIKKGFEEKYSGADNSGKWMLLEEDMDAEPFELSAVDAQQAETRKLQIEEVGRVFGTPRPLLSLDDTNWGSGVDALGQLFVRYSLQPWFTAWEQAGARSFLTDEEKERYEFKFNAGGLLRGSMKDQGEFFAKALGAGGHQPWMTANEVRGLQDMPEDPDGNTLGKPANVKQEPTNVPSQSA